MDDKLHLIGVGEIDSFGQIGEDLQNLKVTFRGITLSMRVPLSMVNDARGVRQFHEDDSVLIDCVVEEENFSKSFNENSYVKSNMRIRKVVKFEKYQEKAKG